LLDHGKLIADGPSADIVGSYLNTGMGTTAFRSWENASKVPGDNVVRLQAVRVCDEEGKVRDGLDIRYPVKLEMEYELFESGIKHMPWFALYNQEGTNIFTSVDNDPAWRRKPRPAGRYTSTAWIPGNFLTEGTHFVQVGMHSHEPLIHRFNVRDAIAFQVIDTIDGDSARADHGGNLGGVVRPMLKWDTEFYQNGHAG
jgi:lipopolysaccharide transport system ATP-binding protein